MNWINVVAGATSGAIAAIVVDIDAFGKALEEYYRIGDYSITKPTFKRDLMIARALKGSLAGALTGLGSAAVQSAL